MMYATRQARPSPTAEPPDAWAGWTRTGKRDRWVRICTAPSYAAAWSDLLALTERGGERIVARLTDDPNAPPARS